MNDPPGNNMPRFTALSRRILAPVGGVVVHVEAECLLACSREDERSNSVIMFRWVLGPGPALVHHPPGLSSDSRRTSHGVNQVTGQCGSKYKPVIHCDIFYKFSMCQNGLGLSLR